MTKIFLLLLVGTLAAVTIAQTPSSDSGVPPQPPPPHPDPKPKPVPIPSTPAPAPTSTKAPLTTPPPQPPITTKPTEPTKPTTTTKPTEPTKKPTPKPTEPTPKPTPSPPPKPVDPEIGIWQVNYTNSNTSYLMVQFAMQIEVPYNTTFNKTQSVYLNVPKNASADGEDQNQTQSITLEWTEGSKIALTFIKENGTKKYGLEYIQITLHPTNASFPDINNSDGINLVHNHSEFVTSLTKSYKCAKKQQLNLTDLTTNKPRGFIHISHLQFEAFNNITNKQFSSAEDCAPYDTPDVVPIAVGCALAALVIVVVIAYLIGRKRRQARGYLSMFTDTKRESDYIPMKNLSCFQ